MMKDMKWKQIDTTYAGKAYQVEAEEINLHGEVNITGSLSVNGGSISTPTAADVSYDNTTSGLTADDVQDAVDELADVRVKAHNFNNLAELATWCKANFDKVDLLNVIDDNNHVFNIMANDTKVMMNTIYVYQSTIAFSAIEHDGTDASGYSMQGNGAPYAVAATFGNNRTFRLIYVDR